MIKYKVTSWDNEVVKVKIVKETKKQVIDENNRRSAKITDHECYFDTFTEARDYLVNLSATKIADLNKKLQYEQKKLQERLLIVEV